jgi:hypothetical protein
MYGFLFDQTYINLIILGFFLFLIMFLWRKITIIEGNYFILEKRVDMIKKTERDSLISKNMEKADVVMNEIFKDSTGGKKNYCNNVGYCPQDANLKSQKTNSKDSEDLQDIDMSSYMIDSVGGKVSGAASPDIFIRDVDVADDPYELLKSNNKIEIIEYNQGDVVINKNVEYGDDDNASDVPSVVTMDMVVDSDTMNVIYTTSTTDIARGDIARGDSARGDIARGDIANVDNIDNDTMSVSSDITFGTDHDKLITKKYKKMSIEKLRDECVEKSLNSEGTKAILIGRILEYNKKV